MTVFNRDLNEINWYAERANSAYQCASEIQKKYPNTVHVSSLETIDVQYFLETFSSEKVQVVSVRGTANLKNVEEDAEYLQSKTRIWKFTSTRGSIAMLPSFMRN